MLFNSYSFIFLFLPITFFGMLWIGKYSHRLATLWLGFLSLTFYAIWDARFVLLLLSSISFNYGAGYWIGLQRASGKLVQSHRTLVAAIIVNLAFLCYFKYTNFFIASANALLGSHISELNIILPLGISFFTFTQIAFLVDVYRGIVREYNFIYYLLFVAWFPHLIAGPVIHHKQVMPQFTTSRTYHINYEHVAVGVTIFILGLAKKVLIADNLAEYATPIFTAASQRHTLMLIEAWVGALAFTLQLYFDFSGYSDMAIGLSLMFNVRLPLNFNSPYKATNIIDFWRRWHMTLSAFLKDYLYIPLGGNRKGIARRYGNLMATMLLGGLWHGAGWTYVIWGGLHGIYLLINHCWRELRSRLGWHGTSRLGAFLSGALTFLAVVIAWVIFRADSVSTAQSLVTGMAGINGVSISPNLELGLIHYFGKDLGISFNGFLPATDLIFDNAIKLILIGLFLVWFFPNVREIMINYKPTWDDMHKTQTINIEPVKTWQQWRPKASYAIIIAALFYFCVSSLTKTSEFLYFQF